MSELVDFRGCSVAELLGEGGSQAQTAIGDAAIEENLVESRVSPVISISMPEKLPLEIGRGSSSLNVTPVKSPLKRAANVMLTVDGGVGDVLESGRPTKSSGCDFWKGS